MQNDRLEIFDDFMATNATRCREYRPVSNLPSVGPLQSWVRIAAARSADDPKHAPKALLRDLALCVTRHLIAPNNSVLLEKTIRVAHSVAREIARLSQIQRVRSVIFCLPSETASVDFWLAMRAYPILRPFLTDVRCAEYLYTFCDEAEKPGEMVIEVSVSHFLTSPPAYWMAGSDPGAVPNVHMVVAPYASSQAIAGRSKLAEKSTFISPLTQVIHPFADQIKQTYAPARAADLCELAADLAASGSAPLPSRAYWLLFEFRHAAEALGSLASLPLWDEKQLTFRPTYTASSWWQHSDLTHQNAGLQLAKQLRDGEQVIWPQCWSNVMRTLTQRKGWYSEASLTYPWTVTLRRREIQKMNRAMERAIDFPVKPAALPAKTQKRGRSDEAYGKKQPAAKKARTS
jgi:hypothetical protein